MAEGDDAFDFGEFTFAPPLSPSHSPSTSPLNGFSQNPHVWGSFFSPPLPHHQANPAHLKPDLSSFRPDPSPVSFSKPNGALPLSLFGEVEDDDVVDEDVIKKGDDLNRHTSINGAINKINGGFDPNTTTQNEKIGNNHQQIMSRNGSTFSFDNNNNDDDDDGGVDDDDWEFKGAFPGNSVLQGSSQEQGGSNEVAGAKVEPVAVMAFENQAGQDASKSVELKPGFSSFFPQSDDLFAASHGGVSKASDKDIEPSPTTVTNGFVWDAFPVVDENHNLSSISASIAKPGPSSILLQSNNSSMAPSEAVNKSCYVKDVGSKTTTTSNGFTWDAFSGIEKVIDGNRISQATVNSASHFPASSFLSMSHDLFALPKEVVSKSSETDVRYKPTTVTPTGFMWDAFTGDEKIANGIGTNASASTFDSAELKSDLSKYMASEDLFTAPLGPVKSTKRDIEMKPTAVMADCFAFDAFPEVKEVMIGNEIDAPCSVSLNEDNDFDDFGDFVDASQDFKTMEKDQVVTHTSIAETQSPVGISQDRSTQLGNGRGALPLSLFCDEVEETSESLNHHEDNLIPKPTSNPGNGLSGQSSGVPIHDLISSLYSQGQNAPSEQPAENDVHDSKEEGSPSSGGLCGDDDCDDNSWEFKGAFAGTGVKESGDSPGNSAHTPSGTSQNIQIYIGFYTKLRDSLCFLLSGQLDELKKSQSLDTGTFLDLTEASSSEMQELVKLLEQSLISQEVLSGKHGDRSSCLNEVFEILQGPDVQAFESEYSLSKKLELAVHDWRVAVDLLRHAISVMKSLSLGSADEQVHYVRTWSKVITVCAQELRYGALIWKRTAKKKVQHQVVSDSRGKKYIRALGEIYKVVELLGLSAKVYRPWLLLSMSDSLQFTGLLDECRTLWSSSGLKQALEDLLDNNDFGCDERAKALVASIKDLRDFDVLAMSDCVFGQSKSICHLSLLPQEIFSDLKTVLWNGEPYFLNLANLWANLISCDPPPLPRLLVN